MPRLLLSSAHFLAECICVGFLLMICVVSTISAHYARTVSYQEEVLVKCSGLQRDVIQHLMETVDVWHAGEDGSVDFRVRREEFQEMKGNLPECREEGGVEELVREMERAHLSMKQQDEEWFEEYHDYNEIVNWYQELSTSYPNLVRFVPSIGVSLEGRDQPAVHITNSTNPKKYFFQCQIHAREWISGATCMFIANYLAESYDKEERIKDLLDETEFVIFPFVNPDGYVYTWSEDRLWRKNRRPGDICYGVDLNRNYPDHWAEGGSSNNSCSETYHGVSAASEPETQNSINYFKAVTEPTNPVYGGIDWHSYSQLILRPYGWVDEDAPDEEQLRLLGDKMATAIFLVHGVNYTSEKSSALYPTTGCADDWFYSDDANENNGDYRAAAYTIELRDTGEYGFALPPEQIIPTGQEIVEAVVVFAEALNKEPLKK